VEPHEARFADLLSQFPAQPAARNIVLVDVECIRDSCGYGVPEYEFGRHRDSMRNWIESKTEEEMLAYREENNSESLDGLPGLEGE